MGSHLTFSSNFKNTCVQDYFDIQEHLWNTIHILQANPLT